MPPPLWKLQFSFIPFFKKFWPLRPPPIWNFKWTILGVCMDICRKHTFYGSFKLHEKGKKKLKWELMVTSRNHTLTLWQRTEGGALTDLLILASDGHGSLSTAHLGNYRNSKGWTDLFTVYKLTRVWIITGNQSLFLQVKDWVCNDPGCPSLWWVINTNKKRGNINHLPKFSKFEGKKNVITK